MNSPDDLMSTKHTQNSPHSGALGLWIVLATSVILLAFVFSWMLQNEPWTDESYVFPHSGHHSESPPVTELKLLAAEVVSRVRVADGNPSDRADGLSDSAKFVSDTQSSQLHDVDRASGPERLVKSSQDDSSLNFGMGTQDGFKQHSRFLQSAQSRQPIDDIVLARFEASTNLADAKNGFDEKRQIYSARSSSKDSAPISVSNSEELTPEKVRIHALDSVALKSQEILFAEQSNFIPDEFDSVLTDISNILSLYDDTEITVAVSTREYNDVKQNIRLSQERGRAIIFRLVSLGVNFTRFSLDVSSAGHSPEVSHMVKVSPWPSVARLQQ